MEKKKIALITAVIIIVVAIYFPGFSRLQQLKEQNRDLERKISELRAKNKELEKEIHKLETDPTYLESVAREKLKKAKKGEIVYRTE